MIAARSYADPQPVAVRGSGHSLAICTKTIESLLACAGLPRRTGHVMSSYLRKRRRVVLNAPCGPKRFERFRDPMTSVSGLNFGFHVPKATRQPVDNSFSKPASSAICKRHIPTVKSLYRRQQARPPMIARHSDPEFVRRIRRRAPIYNKGIHHHATD